MPATHQELDLRLEQLERSFQELTKRVNRPDAQHFDLADAISFRAWLKLSAPTFAILTVGFTLLWNAQQAHSAQMFEMSRSLGRLDGAVAGLESRFATFDRRMERFDERLGAIDERLGAIDQRLGAIDERLGAIDERLGSVDSTLQDLARAIDRLAERG